MSEPSLGARLMTRTASTITAANPITSVATPITARNVRPEWVMARSTSFRVRCGAVELHEAAARGDVETVAALLDGGAAVDALDPWENTPLLLACFSETHHPEVIALLRERGADPYRRNIHWDTPRSQAYERFLISGFDPLADLPAPAHPETEAGELSEAELAAVVEAVRAVVERDREALDAIDAYAGGDDPYTWTRGYGRWGEVELVMPPGDPRSWEMHVMRNEAAARVEVEMWTRQEGRSDLTLKLDVDPLRTAFRGLYVM